MNEFRAVVPLGIFRVGQCDAVGVASVPGVLGSLDFLPRGCFGERRQWRARIHDFPFN